MKTRTETTPKNAELLILNMFTNNLLDIIFVHNINFIQFHELQQICFHSCMITRALINPIYLSKLHVVTLENENVWCFLSGLLKEQLV